MEICNIENKFIHWKGINLTFDMQNNYCFVVKNFRSVFYLGIKYSNECNYLTYYGN